MMYMSWSPSQEKSLHTTERRANGMQVAFAESEREGKLGVDDDTTPPPTQAPLNSSESRIMSVTGLKIVTDVHYKT